MVFCGRRLVGSRVTILLDFEQLIQGWHTTIVPPATWSLPTAENKASPLSPTPLKIPFSPFPLLLTPTHTHNTHALLYPCPKTTTAVSGSPPAATVPTPSFPPAGATGNPFGAMFPGMMMGGLPGGQQQGGFPGMGTMGGMPDPSAAAAMMQNPAMRSMMSSMLASPGFLDMAASQNPMLAQMLAANPSMRTMLSNPAFVEAIMGNMGGLGGGFGQGQDPLAAMMMMGGMPGASGLGTGTGTGAAAPTPAVPGATPSTQPPPVGGMGNFFAMMQQMQAAQGGLGGGMGMFGLPGMAPPSGVPAAPALPPAERFASQLVQMREMGFTEDEKSLRALSETSGSVQVAIERILDGRYD